MNHYLVHNELAQNIGSEKSDSQKTLFNNIRINLKTDKVNL